MKTQGALPEVSQDVREIIEDLEKQKKSEPNAYEKICRESNKIFGSLTKNMKITKETREKIAWSGTRTTPSEWWAGFIAVTLLPTTATVIAWTYLVLSGTPLLSLWYLPILGLTISALFGLSFYYYPTNNAEIRKTEARSRAIKTVMLMSFSLHHREDIRGAAIFASNASGGKLSEDIRNGLLEMDQKREYESVREMLTVIAHN